MEKTIGKRHAIPSLQSKTKIKIPAVMGITTVDAKSGN